MSPDFTIPAGITPEAEKSLLKLVADYDDGYLTEKGFIKKRYELLSSIPPSDLREHIQGSTTSGSQSVTDDFYLPGSSQSGPTRDSDTAAGDETQYYESSHFAPVLKDLQKPLDPRDIDQYTQTEGFDNLAMTLRKRAEAYAREAAIFTVDQRGKESHAINWEKLSFKAEKVAREIKNKAALYPGDRVCLIYQNIEVIDFVASLFGCFLSGTVAVPINSGLPVKELSRIMVTTQSHLCLMSESVYKHFEKLGTKKKERLWPKGVDIWKTSDMGTYQPSKREGPPPIKVTDLAYIEFTRSSSGELFGVAISHATVIHQVKALASMLQSSPDIAKGSLVRDPVHYNHTRNLILSTLDARESIGLVMGCLFAVYSGNPLLWTHQKSTEVPGLYAHIISKFRASILLSDYISLKQVAYNYQSFPQLTRTYNKRVKIDLSSVKWCLINTMTVDCEFDDKLSDRWFKPLGHHNPRHIIAPILSLSDHGGAVISMRDWIGREENLGCIFQKPVGDELNNDDYEDEAITDGLSEVLIDRDSLTTNTVKIVSDRPPSSTAYDGEPTEYVRVGAFGYPIPDATLAIVDPETRMLSSVMEVGEIWVDSPCISGGYWGHPEESMAIFQAECSDHEGVLNLKFLRTGLLGFIYNGKVYVLGLYEDRINQAVTSYDRKLNPKLDQHLNFKYHYASHLVKTIVRSIPEATDCAFFNVTVSNEYVPMAIVESPIAGTRNDTAFNDIATQSFKVISKIHNVRLFCVVITKTNSLPRTLRSGRLEIANTLCKKRFLAGRLSSVYAQFNFQNTFATIHHGDDIYGGIWSPYSSAQRADVLSYAVAQFTGIDLRESTADDRNNINLAEFNTPMELIQTRAARQSDELALAVIEPNTMKESRQLSWRKLEARIHAICAYILEKHDLKAGDTVILLYPLCEEFVLCIHACWQAGLVVIPLAPLDTRSADADVRSFVRIIAEYNVKAIFVNAMTEQTMKNKPFSNKVKQYSQAFKLVMPKYRNTTKHTKTNQTARAMYKRMESYRGKAKQQEAMIWIAWTADNSYKGCKLTFRNIMSIAMNIKETCQMGGTKPLMACSQYTEGFGFLQTCIMGPYLGASTYLYTAHHFAMFPTAFWSSAGRLGVESMYVTPKMLGYSLSHDAKPSKCNLSKLKNLMVGWSGRPDWQLIKDFGEFFSASGLPSTSVSNLFQHPLNPMVTSRSFLSSAPMMLTLDPLALLQGYVSLVNPKDTINNIMVEDSGIVPLNTQIAIVNPETHKLCKVGELGEIWIYSQSTVAGASGKDDTKENKELNHGHIEDWNRDMSYLRTGDFGFLHSIHKTVRGGKEALELQLLFNLGKIEETFEVMGLQYFATDIERTVEHFNIIDKASVFKAGKYVVLILETRVESDLSPVVPLIVMKLMNKFRLIVDIITFVGPGKIPISRYAQIQRQTLLKQWMDSKVPSLASFGINFGETSSIKMLEQVES